MQDTTLLFPIIKKDNKIIKICLGLKKRGFGVDRWNGFGGKINQDETIEKAMKREVEEEISIIPQTFEKVARMDFSFLNKTEFNTVVHTYLTDQWEGEITESEEMKPQWFLLKNIPYKDMWVDDIFWLPEVLSGRKLIASFEFNNEKSINKKQIKIVNSL